MSEGINLSINDILKLEAQLTHLHDCATQARDAAQTTIAEIRETKTWLTELQIKAMKAERESK